MIRPGSLDTHNVLLIGWNRVVSSETTPDIPLGLSHRPKISLSLRHSLAFYLFFLFLSSSYLSQRMQNEYKKFRQTKLLHANGHESLTAPCRRLKCTLTIKGLQDILDFQRTRAKRLWSQNSYTVQPLLLSLCSSRQPDQCRPLSIRLDFLTRTTVHNLPPQPAILVMLLISVEFHHIVFHLCPSQEGTSGKTALHFAVELRDITSVKLLLSRGANVDTAMFNGCTPLHIAVGRRDASIANILCQSGADTMLRNMEDETALDLANGNDDVSEGEG